MADHNPTSRDIAEAAGVSQATVSRALRNSPLVRKETRDRIHRIARELNYIVNRNAAGFTKKRDLEGRCPSGHQNPRKPRDRKTKRRRDNKAHNMLL